MTDQLSLIMTFDRNIGKAIKCQDRLRTYGFQNLALILGDEQRTDVFYENRNFVAACEYMIKENLQQCLLFEEDVVEFKEGRIISFQDIYKW
jgi:hypothetical protein